MEGLKIYQKILRLSNLNICHFDSNRIYKVSIRI